MLDKAIFNKICNVESTLDELIEFSSNRGKNKIDFFAHYYNHENIQKCISLYKDGKVTAQYLSEWAYCYASILRGCGTVQKPYDYDNRITFKELVENQILVLLAHDLTEYHLDVKYYGKEAVDLIDYWEKLFVIFDEIYTTLDEWQPYYCLDEYENDLGDPVLTGDAIVTLVNRRTKKFYQMMIDDYVYTDTRIEAIELSYTAYDEHVEKLKDDGYTEILPDEFDEE